MKKILFPTDFSATAANAFSFASALAQASGASISLLHTYRVPMDYHIPADLVQAMDKDEKETSLHLLERFMDKFYKEFPALDGVLKVDFHAVLGFTSEAIANEAQRLDADLIVMGTKGASGLSEVLLGSMAASVIEEAKCPVLVVPDGAVFSGISNILYASDFSPKDYNTIHQLVDFGKLFKAKTHCVHITNDEDYFIDDVSFDLMKEQYDDIFPKDKVDFKVLLGKNMEHGMQEAISAYNANIVAMTTRKRSFLEQLFSPSQTKKMAYHSKIPLLAFHS
jgi:nucleotide-binding universal stress UspA family protein